MPIKSILIHPDKRLRTKAVEIIDLSDEYIKLADTMLETMYAAPGIGLAAPQIGSLLRLIVLDCNKVEESEFRPLQMFNTKIMEFSEERDIQEEGCLSIPDQFGEVERPSVVSVGWVDKTGIEKKETFEGIWARCIQHEIDHLEGKLFIDYLTPLRRQLITRKMKKLKKGINQK
jgi:peptide deformylase